MDSRGSPVLFSPVLFFDQLSESTLPRESFFFSSPLLPCCCFFFFFFFFFFVSSTESTSLLLFFFSFSSPLPLLIFLFFIVLFLSSSFFLSSPPQSYGTFVAKQGLSHGHGLIEMGHSCHAHDVGWHDVGRPRPATEVQIDRECSSRKGAGDAQLFSLLNWVGCG